MIMDFLMCPEIKEGVPLRGVVAKWAAFFRLCERPRHGNFDRPADLDKIRSSDWSKVGMLYR